MSECAPLAPTSAHDADLDRVAAAICGWRTQVTPLARGTNRGSVSEAAGSAVHVVRLAFGTRVALDVHALGAHPSNLLHIGTISSVTLWEGRPVSPDAVMLKEGEVGSSLTLPAGCELLVARLDRARVDSIVRALRGPDAEPRRGARLYGDGHATLGELRANLGFLARPDAASEAERLAAAEAELYERVAALLAAPPLPGDRPPAQRRRALRRAVDYMRVRSGAPVPLSELCIVAECSERTLRAAFRETYGTSPAVFLKRLRLEGLRRDLRDHQPHRTTVAKLAARWGFWHMGHLGHDYRELFGEPPSQTLLRPASLGYLRTSRHG